MEPYRPYIDELVIQIINKNNKDYSTFTRKIKMELLSIPVLDVTIQGQRRPLMIAAGQTTASLYKCYNNEARRIVYPEK